MISLEAVPKLIDTSQLTPDLEGTLQYDHAQWIDLRMVSASRKSTLNKHTEWLWFYINIPLPKHNIATLSLI